MSVPERTGRVRPDNGCRWCGPDKEIVKFEVRDPETGGICSEVMCCLCGRHQWRWGWERQFWARERQREIARGVLIGAWFAAEIIRLVGPRPRMSPEQAVWVRVNVWPTPWLRLYQMLPGPFLDCACQRPPSIPCQSGEHHACQHDNHPVRETVIQTSSHRAALFAEPYEHRPLAGCNGRRDLYGRNDIAWVWLAGTPCRETCSCVCHGPNTNCRRPSVKPAPVSAQRPALVVPDTQPALFPTELIAP